MKEKETGTGQAIGRFIAVQRDDAAAAAACPPVRKYIYLIISRSAQKLHVVVVAIVARCVPKRASDKRDDSWTVRV